MDIERADCSVSAVVGGTNHPQKNLMGYKAPGMVLGVRILLAVVVVEEVRSHKIQSSEHAEVLVVLLELAQLSDEPGEEVERHSDPGKGEKEIHQVQLCRGLQVRLPHHPHHRHFCSYFAVSDIHCSYRCDPGCHWERLCRRGYR